MIIDEIRLAGYDAYISDVNGTDSFNLGTAQPRTGRTGEISDGKLVDVSGIRLTIRASNLFGIMCRTDTVSSTAEPLISVSLIKEVFPGLFADPFRHRVYTVSGFEDFQRGSSVNCRVMEVEGTPTLVSSGTGEVAWTSPVFSMPAVTRFTSAAWDIASSRHAPLDAFRYSIAIRVWTEADEIVEGQTGRVVPLVTDLGPSDPRFIENLFSLFDDPSTGGDSAFKACQIIFTARVSRDTLISERHTPALVNSLGRPLLRGLHFLEPIESIYDYYSLSELLNHCSEYYLPESSTGTVTYASALLDLNALLVRGTSLSEYIEITVRYAGFDVFEAMLDASVRIRPPRL